MGDDDGMPIEFPIMWRGFEIYRDSCMTVYLRGRWRFIWHNPRFRENWRVDWIFNEGVRQVGIGPAEIVYVRSDDY